MALYGINQFAGNIGAIAGTLCGENEIMGLENLGEEEIAALLGNIEALGASPMQKNKARVKVTKAVAKKNNNMARETKDLTGKALFEQRISQVAPDVRKKLENGTWQLVPFTYYSMKPISGINHVDMFENGDLTSKGVTNIVQGRLPAEDFFLCTAVRVRTATAASEDLAKAATWNSPCGNVSNGEWKLGLESVTYVDKCAASVFDHANVTTQPVGFYELETPKMFNPQRQLHMEFDLVGTVPENTWLRTELIGIKTAKA